MSLAGATTGLNAARWLVIVTVLSALGLEFYSVIGQGAKFDAQQFGIGLAAILFGGGGMMYLNPTVPNGQQAH
jgi:hypothetical protein